MSKFQSTTVKIIMLLVLLGAIAAGFISWQRYNIEEKATTVEMVYDYNNIIETASVENTSLEELCELYKQSGITSLAIYDETVEKLMNHGHILAYRGSDLLMKGNLGKEAINAGKVYLQPVAGDIGKSYFNELKNNLTYLLRSDDMRVFSLHGIETIEVNASYQRFLTMPLGIFKTTLQRAGETGFYLVLRPHNQPHISKAWVDQFLSVVDSSSCVSAIIFQGKEVFGYKDYLEYMAKELTKRHVPVALIEAQNQLGFERQAGITDMAQHMNYETVRLYAMSKEELIKINPKEAASRFYISTIERNIRMNLFPSYKFAVDGNTLSETNAAYISDVKNRIIGHGFSIGKASLMDPYFPPTWLKAMVVMGAASLGVWLLMLLFPPVMKYGMPLEILAVCVAEGGFFFLHDVIITQMLALISAIATPVIVVTLFMNYCLWRKKEAYEKRGYVRIFSESVALLWTCGLLSLAGALYISGLLSDIRFFLEMEIFRGVKVTFVLPLLLISLIYVQKFPFFGKTVSDGRDFINFVKKFCQIDIKLGLLALLGGLGVAGLMFIGRSGNNGAPVPHFEIMLRRFLESIMYARPREKEFFLGHPALFLALAATYKKWPQILHYLFIIAVTIGQGSMVETFAHMRSPFLLSFVRGLDGLLVGSICMGIVLIGTILLTHMTKYLGDRYEKE